MVITDKKEYNKMYYKIHKESIAEAKKARYASAYRAGVCITCYTNKALPNHCMCGICRKKVYVVLKAEKMRRKINDLCIDCGRPLMEDASVIRCINCRNKIRTPKKRVPLLEPGELTKTLRSIDL